MLQSLLDRCRQPMGRDERRAEIARLELLRNRALFDAPGHRWLARGLSAAVLAACFVGLVMVVFGPTANMPLAIVGLGVIFLTAAWIFWRSWVIDVGRLDPWDLSDRYPGEEGSARTLQEKIDRLRQEAGPWG